MSRPESFRELDAVYAFYNPESTRGMPLKSRLEEEFSDKIGYPPVVFIESPDPSIEDTDDFYHEIFGDSGKRLGAGFIGGDGSPYFFVRYLQNPNTNVTVSETPLWVPGGGSSDNLTHIVTAKKDHVTPENVLLNGAIEQFYPVKATISPPESKKEEINALTILGFGSTALSAGELNHPDHRDSWTRRNVPYGDYIVDPFAAVRGMMKSRIFGVEDAEGRLQEYYELMFINGPYAARGVLQAPEIKLSGPAREIDIRRFAHIFHKLIGLRLEPYTPLRVGHNLDHEKQLWFRTLEPLFVQADGEHEVFKIDNITEPIPADSEVTVGRADRSVRIFANVPNL